MEYALAVAGTARRTALMRALARFNATNVALTEQEFLQKILDAHMDSLVKEFVTTKVSHVAFLKRFTQEERIAIRSAGQDDATVGDYLELLKAAGADVDLTDPLTAAGLQALEAAGLLAPGRAAEILAL